MSPSPATVRIAHFMEIKDELHGRTMTISLDNKFSSLTINYWYKNVSKLLLMNFGYTVRVSQKRNHVDEMWMSHLNIIFIFIVHGLRTHVHASQKRNRIDEM